MLDDCVGSDDTFLSFDSSVGVLVTDSSLISRMRFCIAIDDFVVTLRDGGGDNGNPLPLLLLT
jgi:hypothetical protein